MQPNPEALPELLPEDGVDVTALCGIMQLDRNTCRWPVSGDGEQTLFCGKQPVVGEVYCFEHCCRAYPGWVSA